MKKLDRYEFIWKAIQKHGYKYNYKKVEYKNSYSKVCIICPEHGEFWQSPNHHLQGKNCPKCGNVYSPTTEEFIEKSKEVHGNKYDYSKVDYINNREKVCIICHEHGEFFQTPHEHLLKKGCHKCGNTKKLTQKEFIEQTKLIHGNKYDYSKVNYKNNKTKVCIICPEHGEFFQTPNSHITKNSGCPKCNISLLEYEIMGELDKNQYNYIFQYKSKWMKRQSLDFYLTDYNISIECQGRQHFESIDFFGGKNGLIDSMKRDKKKYDKCIENNVKLLYFTHYNGKIDDKIYNESNLFFDTNKLIKKIESIKINSLIKQK